LKERGGEKEEEKLEWSVSVEEDSEMEEEAGTTGENANEGRERTADLTGNSGTDGSPERGQEHGRSVLGERPPALGHSSTSRSSLTPRSQASLDFNRVEV
jgi:hypothetical protein